MMRATGSDVLLPSTLKNKHIFSYPSVNNMISAPTTCLDIFILMCFTIENKSKLVRYFIFNYEDPHTYMIPLHTWNLF